MRDIRVRAWFKEKGEMRDIPLSTIHKVNTSYLYLSPTPMSDYEPIELMEYTGVPDSKGKEICESDILRVHGVIGVVVWVCNCKQLGFYLKVGNTLRDVIYPQGSYALEIIGDVYRTKELINCQQT